MQFAPLLLVLVSAVGEAEQALRWLTQLSTCDIRLSDNPWIMPPEGVVEKGLPEVRAYLLDVRKAEEAGAEVKTLKLLKVVLVGSSQAGKTRYSFSIEGETITVLTEHTSCPI